MVNEKECLEAGLDPKEVARIVKNLSKWGKEAHKLGLTVFGSGTGTGTLRFEQQDNVRSLIVATLVGGSYTGGDGSENLDEKGFLRGE